MELKKIRNKLVKKATKYETEFGEQLKAQGIKYYFQKTFDTDKYKCIVDFYIPLKRIVIELDGGYHYSREQINKDKYRDYWLKTVKKCKVIRIDNESIYTFDFNKLR